MTYPRLRIEEFGSLLLASKDLDPVYCALREVTWERSHIHRWLLAYWCCYHVGASCYISEFEGEEFFTMLMRAARNEVPAPTGDRWPRAKERRHWRGDQANRCVGDLWARYADRPEDMVAYVAGEGGTFAEVSKRAQDHVLFGPWIGFKAADMVERVLGKPVSFDNAAVFMFKDPYKAALWQYEENQNIPRLEIMRKVWSEDEKVEHAAAYLLKHFQEFDAPPSADRKVNIQEVETILCKWKSHMKGHYPVHNDLKEITEGLHPWARHSESARQFLAAMPRIPA